MNKTPGNSGARLQFYYDEHATQARQHENQRERMTNIILALSGVLLSVVTFGKLSIWTLPASIGMGLLGLYGWIFARKHYERNRYHVAILGEIRREMSYLDGTLDRPRDVSENRSLSKIRERGVERHRIKYSKKSVAVENEISKISENRLKNKNKRNNDEMLVLRISLHKLWEGLHLFVMIFAVLLSLAIVGNHYLYDASENPPTKVIIVDDIRDH